MALLTGDAFILESTNEFGCTDIATLNLTINNSSSSTEDVTVLIVLIGMVSFTRRVGFTLESTNEFTDIATLNLTINNSSSSLRM